MVQKFAECKGWHGIVEVPLNIKEIICHASWFMEKILQLFFIKQYYFQTMLKL